MNCLNSVIVEGKTASEKLESVNGKVVFNMETTRYFRSMNGEFRNKVSTIKVCAYGVLADNVVKNGTFNRGIKIVGRIESENNEVVIVAEHIEYKPVFKKD